MMTGASDAELLAACGHDPEAFRLLYRRHVTELLAYLRRGAGDSETAVELLAETMAKAYEHRGTFDPARGDVPGWLYGIARNELRRYWRRQRVERQAIARLGLQVPVVDEESARRIDALLDTQAHTARLQRALAALPASQRTAVLLRVVHEQDYADVAERLGCTVEAARVRVHRGLARLKTRLEDDR